MRKCYTRLEPIDSITFQALFSLLNIVQQLADFFCKGPGNRYCSLWAMGVSVTTPEL